MRHGTDPNEWIKTIISNICFSIRATICTKTAESRDCMKRGTVAGIKKRRVKQKGRKKNATLHSERRWNSLASRPSRAFLQEFNENRNWICSLRGITPVAPPTVVVPVPGSSRRPRKSCPFCGRWSRRVVGRATRSIWFTGCSIATREHHGLYLLRFGLEACGNWTRNLFHASARCAPYVITGWQFSYS